MNNLSSDIVIFNSSSNGLGKVSTFENLDDITHWANKYFHCHIQNSPYHTQRAKKADLNIFLSYFTIALSSNLVDLWTPTITKGLQNNLATQISTKTDKNFAATSINRILVTVKHFANWILKERKLLGGNPFLGVKFIQVDDPEWNGLSSMEITRLKAACEIRLNAPLHKKTSELPPRIFSILRALLYWPAGIRTRQLKL